MVLVAPHGTPQAILDKLNKLLADPKLRDKLGEVCAEPQGGAR